MNKKLLALAVAGALAAPLSAQAVDVSSYGQVGAKLVIQKDHTWDVAPRDFRLGFQAVDDTSAGKFIAQLEVDLDTAVTGEIGVATSSAVADIRTARILWVTQGAGAFVFAPRTPSGNFDDMVAQIDIFGISQGPSLYEQGSRVGNVLAWKSPTSGGLFGAIAIVGKDGGNTNVAEDVDLDVTVWRLVYNGGGLHVGLGQVAYDADGYVGVDKTRTNLGVSYTMGNLYFGASYEDSDNASSETTLGLVASLSAGANTFKIGHTTLSSDNNNVDGAAITEVEVAHDFSKNTSGFVSYWTANQEANIHEGFDAYSSDVATPANLDGTSAFNVGVKVTW